MLRHEAVSSLLRACRCWPPSLGLLSQRRAPVRPAAGADPQPVRDAMQALAGAHGEAAARRRIAELDAVFLRVWPGAPVTARLD